MPDGFDALGVFYKEEASQEDCRYEYSLLNLKQVVVSDVGDGENEEREKAEEEDVANEDDACLLERIVLCVEIFTNKIRPQTVHPEAF